MQYLLLVYHQESEKMSPEEKARGEELMRKFVAEGKSQGLIAGVARLEPTATAITARPTPLGVHFIDGPFAETKEQLGGFCLLDCRDEAEARHWAARFMETGCPSAIEIRPVMAMARAGENPLAELAATV